MPNRSKKQEPSDVEMMIEGLNADVKSLIAKFEEDIARARAIQKTLIPDKFAPIHGFQVKHKYMGGMKSGGDYIDFFEFDDRTHVGILMSDSSGYGLSSAFMSVLLKTAIKFTKNDARSPSETILKIFDELKLTMKPKEELSIFFGILNRKTFQLKYTGAGSIRFLLQQTADPKDISMYPAALKNDAKPHLVDHEVSINPGDRMVFSTDGYYEAFGNDDAFVKSVCKNFSQDPLALINECTYQVKKTFDEENDMPNQDCTVMVIDVEKRAMRLATGK